MGKTRQKQSLEALRSRLDQIGPALAELQALALLMEEGNLGNSAQADRYLRELASPFSGAYPLDAKPSWASCHSPQQLPGVTEAAEKLLAELALEEDA